MIKLVFIVIIFGVIILYLRSINSDFTAIATIAASVIILSYTLDYVLITFEFFNNIIELTGINENLYIIIFKITGIGYLVEFGAGLLRDFGLNSLSDKLVFLGKFIILSVSMPILYAIFNLLTGLLG